MEPESFETPEYGAGVAKQFSDKSVTNFDSVSIENHRAQCSLLAPTRDGGDYSLDGGSPSKHWAKELVLQIPFSVAFPGYSIQRINARPSDIWLISL
jgi:hypothetical protein